MIEIRFLYKATNTLGTDLKEESMDACAGRHPVGWKFSASARAVHPS
uniref:Uncharacterized protein n=1 Tax=Arundo donax TaxID=35708 RepID=A0A0A9BFY9_ARUDO